jgi:hypothetical protein
LRARVPLLAAALCVAAVAPTRADEFARYRVGDSQVVLMTDVCAGAKGFELRQARGRQGGQSLEG